MVNISIALCTFNGATYLPEQLASLAGQHMLPIELQVGDDGSTDETAAIIARFAATAPFPVYFTQNSATLGFGENFIATAKRCSGDWIAFSDQDDIWDVRKLSICAAAIEQAPSDLNLLVHSASMGNERGEPTESLVYPPPGEYPALSLVPGWKCEGFRQIMRRKLVTDYSTDGLEMPWNAPYLIAHDAWACLIGSVTGCVVVISETLVIWRRHVDATTGIWSAVSTLSRMEQLLASQSDRYSKEADVWLKVAIFLRGREAYGETAEHALMFDRIAGQIVDRAGRHAIRAEVHGAPSLLLRLKSWATLLVRGGYTGRRPDRYGTKAIFKDLAIALLPMNRDG